MLEHLDAEVVFLQRNLCEGQLPTFDHFFRRIPGTPGLKCQLRSHTFLHILPVPPSSYISPFAICSCTEHSCRRLVGIRRSLAERRAKEMVRDVR